MTKKSPARETLPDFYKELKRFRIYLIIILVDSDNTSVTALTI